ncbi:hypothetical protein FXO38_25986 [Capsicum annuum]|nr:hypothetical protein FXO38_25986 [Capsicum annuum]
MVFKMQTQNLCPPGEFTVSFQLPGPIDHLNLSCVFGSDGIFEGVVKKKPQEYYNRVIANVMEELPRQGSATPPPLVPPDPPEPPDQPINMEEDPIEKMTTTFKKALLSKEASLNRTYPCQLVPTTMEADQDSDAIVLTEGGKHRIY